MTAVMPLRRKNGSTGMMAPIEKSRNEVIAASQAEPPSSAGSMPSSSRESVSSALLRSLTMRVGQFARLGLGDAAGLVDQRQFGSFFLRVGLDLGALDGDLLFIEFARALHREPLAERHRAGAGQEAGEAGDQDLVVGQRGAGDAHDQAHVGDKAVVGAQHGRAQGVAAAGLMAALQLGDGAALQPAGKRARHLVQHARVRESRPRSYRRRRRSP